MTPTPRAAGIGESSVSIAEGPEAVFFNPSKLAFEKFSHLYTQTLIPHPTQGTHYNNLVYVHPIKKGVWAVQSGILYAGGLTRTVADHSSPDGFQETGSFSIYDFQMVGSFGIKIEQSFGIGASVRFLRESLSDVTIHSFTSDLGFSYRDKNYPLQTGFSLQNLGPQVKFKNDSFDPPSLLRIGLSVHQPRYSPLSTIPVKSLLSLDFFKPFRGEGSMRTGIEIPFLKELLFLRVGYNHRFKNQQLGTNPLPNGLTLGLGIQTIQWRFDYAVVSLGDLGFTHRFAIDYRWKWSPQR